jgi:hypothetical protein
MDWEDKTRERIQKSKLANQLISYVLGETKLEPAQVTAGLGLLKKVLPDLSAVTVAGNPDSPVKMVIEWQSKGS